jgi:hypothetical protein
LVRHVRASLRREAIFIDGKYSAVRLLPELPLKMLLVAFDSLYAGRSHERTLVAAMFELTL